MGKVGGHNIHTYYIYFVNMNHPCLLRNSRWARKVRHSKKHRSIKAKVWRGHSLVGRTSSRGEGRRFGTRVLLLVFGGTELDIKISSRLLVISSRSVSSL